MPAHPPRAVDSEHPDPHPELTVERGQKNDGVGIWVPTEKHKYLCDWLIGTRGAWKNWPRRVLIDPFGGPGRLQVKGETFTRPGGSVVAWKQSQLIKAPFTQVMIGDIESQRVEANAKRLHALGAPVEKYEGAAEDTVLDMIARVPKSSCLALAYLDPYNLEYLSFDVIKTLAKLRKVDFLVHFSVYDLQRNIELETEEHRARFDAAAPGWRANINPSAFAKASLRDAFFEYWCGLVKGLGFGLSESMPLIRADRNSPRYRLVFFSRNTEIAPKVWGDVSAGDNRTFDF